MRRASVQEGPFMLAGDLQEREIRAEEQAVRIRWQQRNISQRAAHRREIANIEPRKDRICASRIASSGSVSRL